MKKKFIYDAIGNTPIISLSLLDNPIYAKLEYLNPGGSIKDRSALYIIQQAEKKGLLRPGGVIIEASSGNQGAAAAMIGNSKGYSVVVTMSKKVSVEKQAVFHAYGAKIILCEPADSFSDPAHYYQVAKKLAKETPNCFFLNQYFNQDNADAHFYGLAPELDSQIGSEITYLFVAMGSAGTANGLARYFKQYRPEVKVIGVDSKNAYYYTNKNPKAYYLDGMGIDYETPFYDRSLFYDVVYVEDAEVHEILKMLAKKHGILVGPSSGGGVAGILRYKDKFNATDCIACLFPDSGRAYLSKNYYS